MIRHQRSRALAILLAAAWAPACSDPAKASLTERLRPTYDKATGRLKELTYDSNNNGRPDTWTEMDGARALRSRIDRDEDGKIDRWEYYDDRGQIVKLGFSRSNDGKANAWAFPDADGKVRRIEISSAADEHRIDRWEYYDSTRSGPDGQGVLDRAEEDTNRDGKPDKWETYHDGAIRTVAFDENGDGIPDRRFTYRNSAVVLIESDADASGRFARRVALK